MPTVVVRYETTPDRADENQALIERVFAELNEVQPDGLRYASLRLADGVSFVHIASVASADGSNPLTELPAFTEFVQAIGDRTAVKPVSTDATVVGAYRMFG
jgi:hypothetical protein